MILPITKKKLLTLLLSLLIVVNLAVITNPSPADIESKVAAELKNEMGVDTGILSWAATKIAQISVGMTTSRQDYKLFSLYQVKFPNHKEYLFLGAFGGFVRLN